MAVEALTVADADLLKPAPALFGRNRKAARSGTISYGGTTRLILWISLLIAAISGLSALYLTNATFGSLTDYITAFLWGFGIQAGTELAAAGAGGVPKIGAALGINRRVSRWNVQE